MKTRKILLTSVYAASALTMAVLTSGTLGGSFHNAAGTSTSTGSPGEAHTCSQATCHGSGNGTGSTGGLPDNGGPGGITISSNPPFVGGNKYVPNTTYHMSITVSETGKAIFGFNAEILDTTGPNATNLKIDNTIGTLTITDATHTQIKRGFGTGRQTVCHTLNGGLASNSNTFIFDWTAPASGMACIYTSGVAGNNDGSPDAADNVYTKRLLGLTPSIATAINSVEQSLDINAYPNPTRDNFTISFTLPVEQQVSVQLISLDGRVMQMFDSRATAGSFTQTYATTGMAKGIYLLKVSSPQINECKRIVIE